MVQKTLAEVAAALGGEVVGDPSIVVRGVAGIREALPGDVTFLANARYEGYLDETQASAVICAPGTVSARVPLIHVDNPYLAFQKLVRVFRPDPDRPAAGVHPTAVVASDATIAASASIGPWCVVERGARVGERVVLMAGGYVGPMAAIGADSLIYPHVTIREECTLGERCIVHSGCVIGSDGFGFAFDRGRYHKVPQVGNVVIGDDVEIGANTTIDRATTDSTRIGEGTKIDNLVQIGHNVVIGRHCIVVAQVGISGSTHLEDFVTIGGQAGLAGHIRVGERAIIGGKTGVSKSVESGETVSGYPALPHGLWKRVQALIARLPQMLQRLKSLEERVEKIERTEESVR